jgi:hypothetical protein
MVVAVVVVLAVLTGSAVMVPTGQTEGTANPRGKQAK